MSKSKYFFQLLRREFNLPKNDTDWLHQLKFINQNFTKNPNYSDEEIAERLEQKAAKEIYKK